MAKNLIIVTDNTDSYYLLRRYAEECGLAAVRMTSSTDVMVTVESLAPVAIIWEIEEIGGPIWDLLMRFFPNPLATHFPMVICSWLPPNQWPIPNLMGHHLPKPIILHEFQQVLTQAGFDYVADNMLEVKDLKKYFQTGGGLFGRGKIAVRAVDGVSFKVHPGETLGLVGESGCGKTTTGRLVVRAHQPTAGEIWFEDRELGRVNIAELEKPDLKKVRRNIQVIFQDPYSSLNPRMTLLQLIGEPMAINNIAHGQALEDRVAELLEIVGLRPEYMVRYPHAFSGGQRQRIGIARALALNPQFIICDEPVSALDVSIQAQILNLLKDLQRQFGLTYLFISHDLSVVEYVCDRVAVMYVGKIVETAPKKELFPQPRHPYTEALLSAIPQPDPRVRSNPIVLPGDVADPANPPTGCYFHPRCRFSDGERCVHEAPQLREIEPDHYVSCHYAETLQLQGVTVRKGVT